MVPFIHCCTKRRFGTKDAVKFLHDIDDYSVDYCVDFSIDNVVLTNC